MSEVPILVCDCGKRLRAPGAVPGRVGRCPACGGILRVAEGAISTGATSSKAVLLPDVPHQTVVEPPVAAAPAPARRKRRRKRRQNEGNETAIWDGLVAPPSRPETRLRDSLLYPFWGASGMVLLVLMAPVLGMASVICYEGVTSLIEGGGTPAGLLGLFIATPSAMVLLLAGGYTLLFLGRMLAASALGEARHPRWPEWDVTAIAHGLGRWLLAGVLGGLLGGAPALVYWRTCGDIGPANVLIIGALLIVGMPYSMVALLASILHEDVWAANPITVIGAIFTLGVGYLGPCVVAGGAVLLAGAILYTASRVSNPLFQWGLVAVFWVVGLYATMVVLRVLGLFYGRHARALGWFRNRKRWGV